MSSSFEHKDSGKKVTLFSSSLMSKGETSVKTIPHLFGDSNKNSKLDSDQGGLETKVSRMTGIENNKVITRN